MPFVKVGNLSIQYKLRRSDRAKRLHLACRNNTFELVVPRSVSNQIALAFLFSQRAWMLKQHTRATQQQHSLWPKAYLAHEQIPYRGGHLCLQIKFGEQEHVIHHVGAQALIITLDKHLTPLAMISERVQALLHHWYHARANEQITAVVQSYCPILKRWPKGVRLKQQKTRWGSCGSGDVIHMNWLLICAPPEVLAYVVIHELCHLWHRNHGKRFWNKVASVMPDYATHDHWLTQNGQLLLQR